MKAYLAGVPDDSFVDKLIFSGVPQLGAPFIFKTLQYGDNLDFTLGPFDLLNPDEVKSIVQNMPGVYELLPSRRFADVDGGYVLRDTTDDAGNASTQVLDFDETDSLLMAGLDDSRNPGLLARADAFHASLDAAPVASGASGASGTPHIYNIVGCQTPTPAQYVLHDDGSVDINRANGDGSVPVDSAMNLANGYQNYFILGSEHGVDHQGLVSDPQPLALVQAIIQGTAASLPLQSLGISTASEDCLQGRGTPRPTTLAISASASSTIDVYDSAGDHDGVNAAGDIDLQIPGSFYDMIGGNTFVTLPASTSIAKVAIKKSPSAKSSRGATTIKVKTYDTAVRTTATTTYTGVPLDASSTAVLTFAPAGTPGTASSTPTPILTVEGSAESATGTVIAPDPPAGPGGTAAPAHTPLACVRI